jgi:hypothetical protein
VNTIHISFEVPRKAEIFQGRETGKNKRNVDEINEKQDAKAFGRLRHHFRKTGNPRSYSNRFYFAVSSFR